MELNWTILLGCAAVAFSTLGLVGSFLALRRARRAEKAWHGFVAPLEKDLQLLCASASKAGDRLLDLENRARMLMEQQEQAELRTPTAKHFKQAIALVQRGATTEELVSTCGLAPGEARLVHALHGKERSLPRQPGVSRAGMGRGAPARPAGVMGR